MLLNFIVIFLIPFVLSLLLTPLIRFLAVKYKLVARPKKDRFHKRVTALLGGVVIFIATVTGLFLFVPFTKNILVFLVGATFIFLWGLTDDFRPMRPQLKLLGQIIASCITIFLGISFNFSPYPWFSYIITIFWIIGITNAFNLLDNMDGLAAGTAVICATMIFITSLMLKGNGIGLIALILAAATLGFLPYNFNPAKIYMGDSGSMFLGFSLATITIMSSYRHVSNFLITLIIPALILGVPIFDTIFVILMRNISGRSIWKGGRDHTSHRLVSLGLSERKTVLLLYFISILFGIIALTYIKINLMIVSSIFTFLTLIVIFFLGFFLAEVQSYESQQDIEVALKNKLKQNKVVLNTVLLYKRHFLEVTFDLILICIAYYSAYLLKYDAKIAPAVFPLIRESLPIIIIIRLLAFFYFGLYRRVWEYISIPDLISIFKSVTVSSILNVVVLTFVFRFQEFSRVVFIIDWLILLFLVSGIRVILPILKEYFFSVRLKEKRILIIGAGNTGEMALREIKRNKALNFNPIGFIDDDEEKVGKKIRGVSILGTRKKIDQLIRDNNIDELFIAFSSGRKKEVNEIISICKDCNVPYRKISGILDLKEEESHE